MREYYSFDEMFLAMEEPPAEEKYESQYDPLWKGILEPTFWHFMAFMFPDAEINFDTDAKVTFLDKELQQLIPGSKAKKGIRHVDKLAKVSLPNGKHRYFLIHIEVQSARGEGDLERRVYQYWSRLYDKYNVPITTVAILADDSQSYRPTIYTDKFMGTEIAFKFNSYKILDQDEDALRANPNPFAVVILTVIMALKNRKANDEKLLAIKRDLFIQMRQRDMSEDCMRGVYNFLARYVHFENQESMFKFHRSICI